MPDPIKDRYYGCGTPLPDGIDGQTIAIRASNISLSFLIYHIFSPSGLDLLDLGSGSGRDCYVAASLVGANGSVTGVDMTDEQLGVRICA